MSERATYEQQGFSVDKAKEYIRSSSLIRQEIRDFFEIAGYAKNEVSDRDTESVLLVLDSLVQKISSLDISSELLPRLPTDIEANVDEYGKFQLNCHDFIKKDLTGNGDSLFEKEFRALDAMDRDDGKHAFPIDRQASFYLLSSMIEILLAWRHGVHPDIYAMMQETRDKSIDASLAGLLDDTEGSSQAN